MIDTVKITDKDALIVVDVQYDFCPGGSLAVNGGDEVVPVINEIAGRFDNVVLTQDWHPPGHKSFASEWKDKKPFEYIDMPYGKQILWPDHCVWGTKGAEIHGKLNIMHNQLIIRKGFRREMDSYSAFFENDGKTPTGLGGYLKERGLNRIFLVGLATDFCIKWSALDGRKLGFDVHVIEEGCRAIDLEGSLEKAWEEMKSAGVKRVWKSQII